MRARIDPIFTGSRAGAWENGGTNGHAGEVNWNQPLHLALAAMIDDLDAQTGQVWTATWDEGAGTITITPPATYTFTPTAEWTTWATLAASPARLCVGHGLPSLIIPREMAANRWPVVYPEGEHWILSCEITADLTAGTRHAIHPAIIPHVLYRGNDATYSLDELDGWVALRPVDETIRSRPRRRDIRTLRTEYDCAIIGGWAP